MSSLPVKRCPGCGIVLEAAAAAAEPDDAADAAFDPEAPPRARMRQQAKMAESLRQVVERYKSHNNELDKALRKSPVGGRLFAAHRFKDE